MAILNGSQEALDWVRTVCGVEETERCTLDMLREAWSPHAIEGEPVDLAYLQLEIRRQLRLPPEAVVTLQEVRQAVGQLTMRNAEVMQQAMTRAPATHSPDDCAATILALCPIDMQDQMEVARETWVFAGAALPDAEILASVLIANRQALHAGDITELQPRTAVAQRYGQAPPSQNALVPATCPAIEVVRVTNETLGERRIEVPLCGKSFLPKRRGQRFGCEHCGEVAHKHKIYLLEVMECLLRQQEPGPLVRKPLGFDPALCTCGQEVGTLLAVGD